MSIYKADFGRLREWLEQIEVFAAAPFVDELGEKALRTLADRLLTIVKPRTPVGPTSYRLHDNPGHEYGELLRSWPDNAAFLSVTKTGEGYTVAVTNKAEYASFVELGHTQQPGRYVWYIEARLRRSFVPGRYFLKLSEEDLAKEDAAILRPLLDGWLKEVFS